jgi:arylformamidase
MYRGMDRAALDAAYNNAAAVKDSAQIVAGWEARSAKLRAAHPEGIDLRYGPDERNRIDYFAARRDGPVLVFIHGGYWRSGSKEDNCNFVPTFTKRGATVVMVEYDLCPQVTVTEIVRQTRASIAWVCKNIRTYGGDPGKLFVAGHSAGGHLTAMALAHDWTKEGLPGDLIKGAVATSGVYDLEMVMKISVQEQVRMTAEAAKLNSPLVNPPRVKCPLLIAVGGDEPKGWQQISEDYFQYCKQNGMSVEYLIEPGANHYTMSEHLLDESSPLTRAMIKQLGL